MTLAAGFEFGTLNRVRLQEFIQSTLRSPAAVVIVEMQLPRLQVANDRVPPFRELHTQAGMTPAEQAMCPLYGRRQSQSLACQTDTFAAIDFCFYRDDVTQIGLLKWAVEMLTSGQGLALGRWLLTCLTQIGLVLQPPIGWHACFFW